MAGPKGERQRVNQARVRSLLSVNEQPEPDFNAA